MPHNILRRGDSRIARQGSRKNQTGDSRIARSINMLTKKASREVTLFGSPVEAFLLFTEIT
jgi:hypothetical protein